MLPSNYKICSDPLTCSNDNRSYAAGNATSGGVKPYAPTKPLKWVIPASMGWAKRGGEMFFVRKLHELFRSLTLAGSGNCEHRLLCKEGTSDHNQRESPTENQDR